MLHSPSETPYVSSPAFRHHKLVILSMKLPHILCCELYLGQWILQKRLRVHLHSLVPPQRQVHVSQNFLFSSYTLSPPVVFPSSCSYYALGLFNIFRSEAHVNFFQKCSVAPLLYSIITFLRTVVLWSSPFVTLPLSRAHTLVYKEALTCSTLFPLYPTDPYRWCGGLGRVPDLTRHTSSLPAADISASPISLALTRSNGRGGSCKINKSWFSVSSLGALVVLDYCFWMMVCLGKTSWQGKYCQISLGQDSLRKHLQQYYCPVILQTTKHFFLPFSLLFFCF